MNIKDYPFFNPPKCIHNGYPKTCGHCREQELKKMKQTKTKDLSTWPIKEKKCALCGVTFYPRSHDTKSNFQFRRFCGSECSAKWRREYYGNNKRLPDDL